MHGYNQPLAIEDAPVPRLEPNEVMVRVQAAGMCRTDVQMLDGYFREYGLELGFPATPGHEIAGIVETVGAAVPEAAHLAVGDQVVVVGGFGCGMCPPCHEGNHQICANGRWPGFGPYGGYSEFVPVPYQWLIRLNKDDHLKPEELAPLTDAGLTPYRGMKKLQHAGVLRANHAIAVIGVGGLGIYGVQYAKLLSGGATVVAMARTDEKLQAAKDMGADATINVRGRSAADVRKELQRLTGHTEFHGILDCSGSEEAIRLGFALLATSGAFVSVGLMGTRVDIPLFPFVAREFSYHGSFWGNYVDLSEVVELARKGLVRHEVNIVRLEDVNESLDRLREGDFIGRAVITFA
jgi:propanol-preferring alcohol dehydrogenase